MENNYNTNSHGGLGVGLGVASLILGILALPVSCCLYPVTLPLGIIAVILAVIVLAKKMNGKGVAIAGLSLGIVAVVVSVVMMIFSFTHGSDKKDDDSSRLLSEITTVTETESTASTTISTSTVTEIEVVKEETMTEASDVAAEPATLDENEIRPEVKEAIDSYEAFMDEYIEFMSNYKNASEGDALSMLTDYLEMLTKYAEAMEKFEKLEDDGLTTAEALYYTEVNLRVTGKLAKAALS